MNTQNITSNSTEEHWKIAQFIKSDGTIETYSNYMVSDQGRIGSLMNQQKNKRSNMKIRKPCPHTNLGHLAVGLCINNKQYTRTVHRLVLSSFLPELWTIDLNEIDHVNRDPTDNRLCNLRWIDSNGNNTNKRIGSLKKIRVTWLDDGHIEEFDNMTECSKAFSKCESWCAMVIRKHNGFHEGLNILIEKI